jgi:hypothetical protein
LEGSHVPDGKDTSIIHRIGIEVQDPLFTRVGGDSKYSIHLGSTCMHIYTVGYLASTKTPKTHS